MCEGEDEWKSGERERERRKQTNIPNKLVSALPSSSASTGLEVTEFRFDGGGVGRFESGL